MTRLEKQKRLNREIATELDKYQVILEYGRLFLDRDKQIRDNYKWISYAKKGCLTGGCIDLIVALLTAFISSELFEKYYVYMIIVLVLTIIIYIAIIFINRKKIAQKLNDVDKNQLIKLLDNLQDYLFMLVGLMSSCPNTSFKLNMINSISRDVHTVDKFAKCFF